MEFAARLAIDAGFLASYFFAEAFEDMGGIFEAEAVDLVRVICGMK